MIEWRCFVICSLSEIQAVLFLSIDISKPRYVRVNTLKLDLKSALQELGKQNKVLSVHCMISLICLLGRHYVQLCFPSGAILIGLSPSLNANFCLG